MPKHDMSKNARPQPNTTETVPTSVQDIESNTPHSDYADSGSLCLTLKGDKDVKIDSSQPSTSCSLDSAKDGQHAPLCSQLNAAPTSTRAAKRTCSSPNDEHPNPSAWKLARTRSNSMETLPDSIGDHLINCDVNWQTVDGACLCDSPMRDATDAANAADEIAELTYDLHAAVEPAELSFDPELGDAAANETPELFHGFHAVIEPAELSFDPELGDAAANETAELFHDLHAAVEPVELSFDPELGDAAANETAELFHDLHADVEPAELSFDPELGDAAANETAELFHDLHAVIEPAELSFDPELGDAAANETAELFHDLHADVEPAELSFDPELGDAAADETPELFHGFHAVIEPAELSFDPELGDAAADETPELFHGFHAVIEPAELSFDLELGDAAANETAELFHDLHAAVETAELSFDPELGDAAANEIAEDPPDEIGELLSGSSQWENVSFPCLHDAVRTSPENGTNQARIHAYEAPFYYTLRCELRRALISVEVEPSHGGGLILSDGVLEDSMLWIAGSGAAPQIPMQQEEHRILSEKKS